MVVSLQTETCWSSFLILKYFNNSTFFNVVCISWKIKCWILRWILEEKPFTAWTGFGSLIILSNVCSWQQGNKPSGNLKCGKSLCQLKDYYLLKCKYPACCQTLNSLYCVRCLTSKYHGYLLFSYRWGRTGSYARSRNWWRPNIWRSPGWGGPWGRRPVTMPCRNEWRLLESCGYRRTPPACGIWSWIDTGDSAISTSGRIPLCRGARGSRVRRMASWPWRAPCRHW